jgi:hypothetical protein
MRIVNEYEAEVWIVAMATSWQAACGRDGVASVPRMSTGPLLHERTSWQMTVGERAAITGLLAQVRPKVAIEIGTAEGGSLRRIAEWADHVHSFDTAMPEPEVAALPNVTLHTGSSHILLPQVLAELAAEGVNVDFALVDGDHSAEGVAADMRDLLASPAVGRTAIVMHDSMNEVVRAGLQAVDYASCSKVRHVELDFVAGFLGNDGHIAGQLWGGLGLVLVDTGYARGQGEALYRGPQADLHRIVGAARDAMAGAPQPPAEIAPAAADPAEIAALREQLERQRYAVEVAEAQAARLRSRLEALEG